MPNDDPHYGFFCPNDHDDPQPLLDKNMRNKAIAKDLSGEFTDTLALFNLFLCKSVSFLSHRLTLLMITSYFVSEYLFA